MERHHDGFCVRVVEDLVEFWWYLGNRGQTDKIRSLYTRLAELQTREYCQVSRRTGHYRLGLGPDIYFSILETFHDALDTKLLYSTAYHSQMNGQSERTIQTLEDILRTCILQWKGNWDEYLSLVEFAYNNNYHSSIGIATFEALYSKTCRTPLCWTEVGERVFVGPEIVDTKNANILLIKRNLKSAQNRQKNIIDKHYTDREYAVGDFVFLKLSL